MYIACPLRMAVDAFFEGLCAKQTTAQRLEYFSTTEALILQHSPAICPSIAAFRVTGQNAVRSYFDILSTHWHRENLQLRGAPLVDVHSRSASYDASITWIWRRSGRRWTEEFNCAITFDDNLKVVSLIIRTDSAPETCVMNAKDVDSSPLECEGRPCRNRAISHTVSAKPLAPESCA
ncbi:hypothetical protein D9611_009506 [Ephemerocybe angulata]|uniref:Uncharacterized protein n=1 Tax=Ephemerocybe angulata TaxID=980116 RepID=A0A8H5AVL6_9AGAR|nr:hypothetical protein D9611_009506 [Tulosesus angulatus]